LTGAQNPDLRTLPSTKDTWTPNDSFQSLTKKMGIKKEERPATIPAGILQFVWPNWLTSLVLKIKKTNQFDEKDSLEFPDEFKIEAMEKKFKPYFEEMKLHLQG